MTGASDSSRNSVKVFFLVSTSLLSNAYYAYLPVFLYLTPDHVCAQNNESVPRVWNETFLSEKYYRCNERPIRRELLTENNISFCKAWIYDSTHGETVVTSFNLICESSWKRPTAQCILNLMVGTMVGSLVGGMFSDKFGRRLVLRVAVTLCGVSLFILSFATNYIFFSVVLFFSGMAHIAAYIYMFIIVQESLSEHQHANGAVIFNAISCCGYLLMPLCAYFVRDWRWLVRIPGLIKLLSIPLFWLMPESSKWLQETKHLNKEISNDTELVKIFPEKTNNKVAKRSKLHINVLLKNKVLMQRLFIVCFLWNVAMLSFYTFYLNTSNLGGNVYLNTVYGGIVDLLSYISMLPLLRKMGRRNATTLCFILSGVMCLMTPLLRNVNLAAGTASSMIGKFFATSSMGLVVLYTGELFPTLLRTTSLGLASMSGRFAGAASPFLVFSGEMLDLSIPFFVMSALMLSASALALLLPETSSAPLPSNLEEALALDKYRFKCKLASCRRATSDCDEV